MITKMTGPLLPNKNKRGRQRRWDHDPVRGLRISVFNMLVLVDKQRRPNCFDLRCAWVALDAMPFSATEYHDIEKRILNAVEYAKQEEFGAARYELLMLLKRLPRSKSQARSVA